MVLDFFAPVEVLLLNDLWSVDGVQFEELEDSVYFVVLDELFVLLVGEQHAVD